jgi:hypothetical protein
MKQIKWIAVALILAALLLIWKSTRHHDSPSSTQELSSNTELPASATNSERNAPNRANSNAEIRSVDTSPTESAAIEVILEKIHDASVAYAPSSIPLIEPYLLHDDPAVRKAAIDGMIVLGERGAVPIMRAAATRAPTPQDTMALLKAAEYIELPSSTSIIRKKKKISEPK